MLRLGIFQPERAQPEGASIRLQGAARLHANKISICRRGVPSPRKALAMKLQPAYKIPQCNAGR